MRHRFRRYELIIYRIILTCCIIIASFIIFRGIVVFASEQMTSVAKKAGVSFIESLYLNATSSCNELFRYVKRDEASDSTLLHTVAEDFSINYYASHQGKQVFHEQNEEEDINYEDTLDYVNLADYNENMDENYRDTTKEEQLAWSKNVSDSENSSIEQLAEEENKNYNNSDSSMSSDIFDKEDETTDQKLIIEYKKGDVARLPDYNSSQISNQTSSVFNEPAISVSNLIQSNYSLEKLSDINYLIDSFYIVDSSTTVTKSLFNVNELLKKNMAIKKRTDAPQILIYHTHASETYLDSKAGVQADTVVGAGNYLTELLEKMGYVVYHDKTAYDKKANGEDNRNFAYSTARPNIEKILTDNPSIEVVIDLHRDSGPKRLATVNGKDACQIMFFNGLCRDSKGPIDRLDNPNLKDNLAFSLQAALVGRNLYPGFVHRNYLKNWRYNQHLAKRYLLIECGTENNNVQEAYNAMEPLSVILNQLLSNP
ncbi:stage II sporulation protein P [Lachnoclostridium phytofermentans]|uniref:Stage II sporulation P family protein n=1 Tax=Lachnoclostridium phytofermentans (strain ATCC 700394 / DSM 18823 / ISDg) TaxID=357809 RepID=A9KKU5_LACP7|nr:stage II sporulation protein P [Lachnoclostridium phytofermentans]ABX42677.1 Stage II sporulation P family protein [Lachnoclostridium phytofermentans ISDg]